MIQLHFPSVSVCLFRAHSQRHRKFSPLPFHGYIPSGVLIVLKQFYFFGGLSGASAVFPGWPTPASLLTPSMIAVLECVLHAPPPPPGINTHLKAQPVSKCAGPLNAHSHLMDVSNDSICTARREEHNNPQIIGGSLLQAGEEKQEGAKWTTTARVYFHSHLGHKSLIQFYRFCTNCLVFAD